MKRRFALALVMAQGCGSPAPSTTPPPGADASSPGTDASSPGADAGSPGTFSISTGPITLQPGEETVVCRTLRLPTDVDTDVVAARSTLAPGSHHLILYASRAVAESPGLLPCQSFGAVSDGAVPIVLAGSRHSDLQMPDGVAWRFSAGQMVLLEAHYINATPQVLVGEGSITFTAATAGVAHQLADAMLCGSVMQLAQQGVPPDTARFTLDPGFYSGGGDVDLTKIRVFALTTHQHHLGAEVTIARTSTRDDPGELLTDNKDWNEPPLQVFDAAHLVSFAPGQGLRWQCTYDSLHADPKPSGVTHYGDSAIANEMCFIAVYYYPSIGHFVGPGDCGQ